MRLEGPVYVRYYKSCSIYLEDCLYILQTKGRKTFRRKRGHVEVFAQLLRFCVVIVQCIFIEVGCCINAIIIITVQNLHLSPRETVVSLTFDT